MATQHAFLGWGRPVLPVAADWLTQRFGNLLAGVTVVLPTRRAGRRLEALLLEREPVLSRPALVTPGGLADRLVEAGSPDVFSGGAASELDAGLAWVSVLRSFERDELAALLPDPPDAADFGGWWSLAHRIAILREQLAAGRKTLRDAAAVAGGSAARWSVLATLEDAYHATLAERGLTDRHAARESGLRNSTIDSPVVLVAVADLTPLHAAVIERCVDVTALVFADEVDADGFDPNGGVVTAHWAPLGLGVEGTSLRLVEQRGDQPLAVAEAIRENATGLSENEVAVGLGEEALGPAVVRAIEQAGGTARTAVGRPLLETGPCSLLAALAHFAESRRFDALAELLRHPDVERFLAMQRDAEHESPAGDSPPSGTQLADARQDWLGLLDRYLSDTVAAVATDSWLGDPARTERLKWVHDTLVDLIPDAEQPKPLPVWSGIIRRVLERIYADHAFDENAPRDAGTVQALGALGKVIGEQSLLAASRTDVPSLTAAQAIRWTLARVSREKTADPATRGDIEVMGLLDLALDDAPVAVVTSLNEGHVPATVGDDAGGLLPGSLRTRLGLPDARRRLARDTYLLRAVGASRASATFLTARHDDEGNPVKPSRLLLLGLPDEPTALRLKWFYGDYANSTTSTPAVHGGKNRFVIPRPVRQAEPVASLSVTAFKDYLTCPYRFYLKHVLKLESARDGPVEMDALAFGILVHDTLAAFAVEDGAPLSATDPSVIDDFLNETLSVKARETFGPEPRAAVRAQIEFARERLLAFAQLQATWTRQGWAVLHTEQKYSHFYDHDSGQVELRGRIDRVDTHPEHGLRVIDFKTGDSVKPPDRAHVTTRGGQRVWLDLQLPLYRDLIDAAGLTHGGDVPATFGYVVLPRKRDEVGWHTIDWDKALWREAQQQRDAVIDGVLSGRFKPSEETPTWDDGLADVCADAWPQRRDDIAAGGFGGD